MKQLKMKYAPSGASVSDTPENVFFRTFKHGEEEAWFFILSHGLFPEGTTKEEAFSDMASFSCLRPEEDIWFALRDGKGIATATGMMQSADVGYLHYICALPEARGTGVATALIRHVIDALTQKGATLIYLTTDDFRLGAIKTYLRLGLVPIIEDEEDRARWDNVYHKLQI